MNYSLKAKRNRNGRLAGSASICGRGRVAEQESVYYQTLSPAKNDNREKLPQKTSAYNTTTAVTNTSPRSIYSCNGSIMGQKTCPVTGVCANISDDYCIPSKVIGKGHYGIVRECIHLVTRQSFAVKSIYKSKISRLDHLQREIFLLANIDHHGIIKMVDCYEDAECVHIITEKYTGGELFDRIIDNASSYGCLSERVTGAIIKSLLEAVAYLHDNEIVHRDIKPENILFESYEEDAPVKLIDFGLSRLHRKDEEPMMNPVGTAYYMSPELLKGKYDKSTDVWSIGVVGYILLCGFPPFNGKSDNAIRSAIQKRRLQFKGNQWLNKSDDAIDFTKCLLRKDPRKRFTVREALMHPWIRKMTFQ